MHRWYQPGTGRYSSPDPIGLEAGINLFDYARSSPAVYTDPLGLSTYLCVRPLGEPPGRLHWPFLQHSYMCIVRNGVTRCDSSNLAPGAPIFPSPDEPLQPGVGGNELDVLHPVACMEREGNNACLEQCIERAWDVPRPVYGIPFGTDCIEYTYDILDSCYLWCGLYDELIEYLR